MLHDERFESFDRKTDWFAALHDVTVPTLAVASSGDHIVPAARARAWADALGGEVEVVEADTAGGMAADYGHLDYTLGERASTEIFPRIEAWLSAHPPRRADAAIRSAAPTRATPAPRPP
jgi:poly(3-hydroxyalkanoate) synthetase